MCLSMKCICDRSYCKQYIYKQGRYKTILEFIILILYVVVTLASISLLYLLFQPAQACCGFINVENGNCNIEFYNANYIDISQIDDISICIDKKKSLLCDSFIRNNTAITLNECISESGYHVPDICSLSNLNTSHPREFSSDFYTWTSVYILVIIMLISKCIYIVMQYFGCLKESCQSCRYHPKYIYGIIFIDICLTFAHLTGVWSGLDTGTYFINDSMLDDNIEDFCTTPDIVWKSSFKYLPWFQDVYQYGCLCVFVAITVLNLCMACNNCGERKLQKDELVKMVKGKNLIIEYPKNHERSIEMTDMQILSTCTKSNNDIINNCAYLHRLVHVIKKYELLRVMDKSDIDNDSKDNFVKLCTKDYSNGNLLDDVYHLQQIHNKQYKQIIEEISLSIFCESLKCTAISRHFTPRNSVISSEMKHEEQEESDGIYDLYANIMDNLHVMFFHSTYEESFNRFKSNDNKYNISQNYDLTDGQMVNDNDAHENVATWIDSIFDNLTNAYNVSHAAINQLNDIIINEHYDSESLMEDLKDIEINQSNIRNEMKDDEVISSMTQTMDTTQVLFGSFSPGKSWKDLYNGKYKDIKEEILNSGHVTKKNFDDQILTKAKEYQGTQRGKQAIYKYKGFEGILEMRKEKGVDHPFSYGDIMSVNHLIAIICYTDYTDLCTAWTATFRPSFIGESQSSIQERQRSYYHLSKNLYQIVNYFGVYCHGQEDKQTRQMNESEGFYVSWCDDSGPFYCGMSRTMPFPSFNIDLNSPTSTSQAIEVATRFSGSNGVIITFNNNGLHDNDRTAFFDARWISHFPEEQEYLYPVRIEKIVVITTKTDYKLLSDSLFYWDAMLDGEELEIVRYEPIMYKKIQKECKKYLQKLINGYRNNSGYEYDTFRAVCYKRKSLHLRLEWIDEQYQAIAQTILYSVRRGEPLTTAPTRTNVNLVKEFVFTLFPNLEVIKINTKKSLYGFSFWNLINLYSNSKDWKSKTEIKIKYAKIDQDCEDEIKSLFDEMATNVSVTFPRSHQITIKRTKKIRTNPNESDEEKQSLNMMVSMKMQKGNQCDTKDMMREKIKMIEMNERRGCCDQCRFYAQIKIEHILLLLSNILFYMVIKNENIGNEWYFVYPLLYCISSDTLFVSMLFGYKYSKYLAWFAWEIMMNEVIAVIINGFVAVPVCNEMLNTGGVEIASGLISFLVVLFLFVIVLAESGACCREYGTIFRIRKLPRLYLWAYYFNNVGIYDRLRQKAPNKRESDFAANKLYNEQYGDYGPLPLHIAVASE